MPARTVTTWTLEMTTRPELAATLPDGVRIDLAEHLTPEFARYLYAVVGGPWTWTDRLAWSREQWLEDLGVPGTETWVAYADGAPAGYVQIQPTKDDQHPASVEIRYFGLVEEAIGRGIGRALLEHGIASAWSLGKRHDGLSATSRVWVHTCDLDGPAALPNYEKRGFTLTDESVDEMDYPDEPLGAWRSSGGPA
ncbi:MULTISPECIES: GNAT family N-acetyltransferase [Dermacoccus]|uniref:GNAT family N-acetyltransferase n=2 Tax=Dermacoccus TaxID=57495 RepID=A0A417Z3B9_9MICO|nr:GNAT family N-acetyltransferase [Dermacoccus abyssi]RHW45210.1 GNAT family N-acetyltransferase [Dermacoccus abyssi]